MSRWRNARFQTKLFILFLLLGSVPSLLIGITAYQKSAVTLHEQTEQDLNVILAQLTTSIERQINDFDRFSMLPYFTPETFSFLNKPYTPPNQWGSAEINAQKTLIRLMSAYPSINSSIKGLMVYGMNGIENGYLVSGNSSINPEAHERETNWYKQVMARKGGFVVTGIQEIKQFVGTPFNAIVGSRLIMDENFEPLAVVAFYILPDFIPKIVKSLELGNAQVIVMDQERNLIYASDNKLADRLRRIGLNQKNGAWETTVSEDANGKTFSGVYLQSDYLGWKVYMGVNRDEMLRGSRIIRQYTIVIVILMGFMAAAISWMLARGLSQPISKLIRSMRDVERGKFTFPGLFDREDEIGQLQRSYVRMVERLDELIHSIEEKERQKRNAELYALRARIQPHFLYNTLNSIRMLAILQQSTQIAKLIQSLNKLLHANLKLDAELVSLEDEIKLLKDYASLMDLRYTNVFEVDWQIPEQVQNAGVPPMLLQPLLENAIFHGAKGLERKLHIVVTAELADDNRTLIIVIKDDGAGFQGGMPLQPDESRTEENSSHIGLNNVRDRIRLRFGDEYGVTVERNEPLTYVTLKMPYIMIGMEGKKRVEFARRRG